jgi:hypothetical protein
MSAMWTYAGHGLWVREVDFSSVPGVGEFSLHGNSRALWFWEI